MIRPLKPSPTITTEFVACDIENRSNGEVLAIDTYDGKTHYTHYDWSAWLRFVSDGKSWYTIYAHNGGGWDWLSFLEWCIHENPTQTFTTIDNGGRIVCVRIPASGSGNRSINLVDSLYLFHTSLDAAGLKYIGRGKIKDPLDRLPEELWENDRPAFTRYHRNDTEILYHSLIAFASLIHTEIAPIGKLGLTLPSTALKIWQTSYLPKSVSIPTNPKANELLQQGYTGGRVEVFKPGHYQQIWVYDFNSLYPSVMSSCTVPDTGRFRQTRSIPNDPNATGCFRIRFSNRDYSRYPIFMVDGVGQYSGEGVYYLPEIRRALGEGYTIEAIDGLVFDSSSILFAEYVERLYTLRMSDKDGPLGAVCKLLMNSLYGKFGQKSERWTTQKGSMEDVIQWTRRKSNVECLSEAMGIYRVSREHHTTFQHVGISGTITSEARGRLWDELSINTVYCDTDSIHTTRPKPGVSNKLGGLKLEFQGEGVYVGKKLYALRNAHMPKEMVGPRGEIKIRAKGVKVGGKMGFGLDFDTLAGTLNGAEIDTVFRSATTANSVLRGGKSCVFTERKRRIRATAK